MNSPTSVQPGPVIPPVAPEVPSCECECCQQKVDPCDACPSENEMAVVSKTPEPAAPCAETVDPCEDNAPATADLIFKMKGVDSGALTQDIKQSILHLFSAMLIVDD